MWRAISLGIRGEASEELSSCDVERNRYTSAASLPATASPARAAVAMPVSGLMLCGTCDDAACRWKYS